MDRRNMHGGVRQGPSDEMKMAHQFLFYRAEEAAAKSRKEQAAGTRGQALKDYIGEHGEPNGDHKDWNFDEPVEIGESSYLGLRRQSRSETLMDEDAARELVESKGLTGRVRKEVTVVEWDWEELFVLNQEGKITDAELDALMTTETTYALVVIQ